MKIAHLILAHKAPAQLALLLDALEHPDAEVFIHLDRKADYQHFAHLAARRRVRFTRQRLDVKWGGYSLTQAALEGMREILARPERYDYLNLLSGEDFPIKPVADIHAYLARHAGRSFLEYDAPGSPWWQANASRVTHYHFTELAFPGRYFLQGWLNRLAPRRRPPLPLYGGNMGGWYTLTPEAARYVLDYLDGAPRLRRFARFSWGTDEFLVHSVLLNSPLAATIHNDNLRYIDWRGGGHSPKVLTMDDLPELQASARLYARKFDQTRDAQVLARLKALNTEPRS